MVIQELTLHQFRCFEKRVIPFDGRVVVIQGPNGSGKSSLLEALHYCCYLRSFRTHLNRELITLGNEYFFVQIKAQQESTGLVDTIHIGFSQADGKIVKWNDKAVQSYKEIIDQFKVITLVAQDVELVQGEPELRRDFLNYALLLNNPALMTMFKQYRHVLTSRNNLLNQQAGLDDTLYVWTQQLWELTKELQHQRVLYLRQIETIVNALLTTYFSGQEAALTVSFDYKAKHHAIDTSFDDFWQHYQQTYALTEREWRRSLFGAHLDDFSITFQDKKARVYASRGQQKLIAFLLKIAQMHQLSESGGERGILLLDDFMTDFDYDRLGKCMAALKDLKFQLFLSCPIDPQVFLSHFNTKDVCSVYL